MTALRRDDPSARLEAAFTRIWRARMEGLPFLNAALRVEAVGFRPWQGEWLGALVTPWFVNLLLLPGAGEWASLPDGGGRIVCLPAGGFRFVCGRDAEIGEYHACSLFSPAQEFADHDTARARQRVAVVESHAPNPGNGTPSPVEPVTFEPPWIQIITGLGSVGAGSGVQTLRYRQSSFSLGVPVRAGN